MRVFSVIVPVGPHFVPPVIPSGTHEGLLPVTRVNVPTLPVGLPNAFFTPASMLTIGPATGAINSGVIATGTTVPAGWDVRAENDDWPYNRRADSWRYGLIGALVPQDPSPSTINGSTSAAA